jgi:hypothetical protein
MRGRHGGFTHIEPISIVASEEFRREHFTNRSVSREDLMCYVCGRLGVPVPVDLSQTPIAPLRSSLPYVTPPPPMSASAPRFRASSISEVEGPLYAPPSTSAPAPAPSSAEYVVVSSRFSNRRPRPVTPNNTDSEDGAPERTRRRTAPVTPVRQVSSSRGPVVPPQAPHRRENPRLTSQPGTPVRYYTLEEFMPSVFPHGVAGHAEFLTTEVLDDDVQYAPAAAAAAGVPQLRVAIMRPDNAPSRHNTPPPPIDLDAVDADGFLITDLDYAAQLSLMPQRPPHVQEEPSRQSSDLDTDEDEAYTEGRVLVDGKVPEYGEGFAATVPPPGAAFSSRGVCQICMDDEEKKLYKVSLCCSHMYCAECIEGIYEHNAPGILKCPGCRGSKASSTTTDGVCMGIPSNCRDAIDPYMVNKAVCVFPSIVKPEHLISFCNSYFGGKCIPIPCPECNVLVVGSVSKEAPKASRCTNSRCAFLFCTECKQEYHGEHESCKGAIHPEDVAYINKYLKPCPNCGVLCEHLRGHGCHNIKCPNSCCGTRFCFLCLKPEPSPTAQIWCNCPLFCQKASTLGDACSCQPCELCKVGKHCTFCISEEVCESALIRQQHDH